MCVVKTCAYLMFAQVRSKLPGESDTLLYGSLRPSLLFQKGAEFLFMHLLFPLYVGLRAIILTDGIATQ